VRKALLVVTLVLASFAGGAFVNGPGLTWLKEAAGLVPHPVKDLGGEAPPVVSDEAPAVSVGPEPEPKLGPEPGPASEPAEWPTTASPTPGDILTGLAQPDDKSEPGSLALESPDSSPAPAPSDPVADSSDPDSPTPPPLEPPAQAQAQTQTSSKPEPTAPDPLPANVPNRRTTPPASAPALVGPAGSSASPSSEHASAEPGWGDAPGSAPAAAILPKKDTKARRDPLISGASMPGPTSAESPDPPAQPDSPTLQAPASKTKNKTETPQISTSPSSSESTWSDLKTAMSARGVSRYWAEGEPSGSVTFRCVVPLAAKGVIAQQFEAQGADLSKAAEAALKRIDLWKATEKR
jgi:hypothetical protein